jgi:hypothetical protein
MLEGVAAMRGEASGRCRAILRVAAILPLFALLSPPSAGAQGGPDQVQFVGTGQGLSFGALIPGEPRRIDPQVHADARAELRIAGRQSDGLVWFEVPTALIHIRGQGTIPLAFGSGDGIHLRAQGGQHVPFDPVIDQIEVRHRGNNIETTIYLGGTATPAADQAGGEYEATITAFIASDS